jgi:hypothetical protein
MAKEPSSSSQMSGQPFIPPVIVPLTCGSRPMRRLNMMPSSASELAVRNLASGATNKTKTQLAEAICVTRTFRLPRRNGPAKTPATAKHLGPPTIQQVMANLFDELYPVRPREFPVSRFLIGNLEALVLRLRKKPLLDSPDRVDVNTADTIALGCVRNPVGRDSEE